MLSIIVESQKPYAQESRELIAQRLEIAAKGVTLGVIQRSMPRMFDTLWLSADGAGLRRR
ncbi:hypothetical protein C3R74_13435 [Acidithiobacillus ferridurans]|nr:hypothetical protein C3R74_13435 [Acidithiobacillus ferridurans]